MTDRFPSISNMIDYINIRHESIKNNNLFDYWMGFFYSSLSCWVQLNRFYIMCFVPLPCCGTYKEPHLPFTIKWIHRKRFHGGFQAANQSLCREISVRHCTSLYTPRSVQCLLTSVPVLQHDSTHHSHWPVTAIILLESSYRMVVICIPTFQSFLHSHVHVNVFANCAKGVFWGRNIFGGKILWVTLEILCVVFLGVWRTVNQVYVLC